jgi:hypothetical protein
MSAQEIYLEMVGAAVSAYELGDREAHRALVRSIVERNITTLENSFQLPMEGDII